MIDNKQVEYFMMEALKEAKKAFEADEVPVGAVVVFEGKIIARAHNQIEMLKDPTAHAEMIAITQASSTLNQKWLHNCTMYVTLEPCSMCAGALVLARIKNLVFGARDQKSGACGSVYNIVDDVNLNHRIDVFAGVFEEECGYYLTEFFKKKRAAVK